MVNIYSVKELVTETKPSIVDDKDKPIDILEILVEIRNDIKEIKETLLGKK